jgi:hypothetical protein
MTTSKHPAVGERDRRERTPWRRADCHISGSLNSTEVTMRDRFTAGDRTRRKLGGFVFVVALGSLGACDLERILEVELPASITEESLRSPAGAQLMVNSVITHFECGYSAFTYEESGRADTWDRHAGAGAGSGGETYRTDARTGGCSTTIIGYNWYQPLMISRSIGFETYDMLNRWTDQQVGNRQRLLATTAIYTAANLTLLGEHFCEMAFDAGPLVPQEQTLALAEEWVGRALDHIAVTGDFALPTGATKSVQTMAYGLRARIRWARGRDHWPGALADALRVPQGYTAWVTREAGPLRTNKVWETGTFVGYGHVMGPFAHWRGPVNPVTGQGWPAVIPFTGYLNLGILPDGRAVSNDRYPITTTAHANAVADHRVRTRVQTVQGPEPGPVPVKYTSGGDDQPLVGWNDIWLIRAEIEGGQAAIDRVNELRSARGLPLVTYANPGDADQILDMIIEERRRDLWLEGRFWSTKIQHPDRLWFPRGFGSSLFQGYAYGGGVTMTMPYSEYELNPNLTLAMRGTGCSAARAPVIIE